MFLVFGYWRIGSQKSSEHLVRFLGTGRALGRSEASGFSWLFAVLPSSAGKSHFQVIEVSLSLGIVCSNRGIVPSGRVLQDASSPRMIRLQHLQSIVFFVDAFGKSLSFPVGQHWQTMTWARQNPDIPLFQAAGGSKCCGCSWFIRSKVKAGSWSCDQTHAPLPGVFTWRSQAGDG